MPVLTTIAESVTFVLGDEAEMDADAIAWREELKAVFDSLDHVHVDSSTTPDNGDLDDLEEEEGEGEGEEGEGKAAKKSMKKGKKNQDEANVKEEERKEGAVARRAASRRTKGHREDWI